MHIEPIDSKTEAKLNAVRSLLSACGLPTADISLLTAAKFLGVEDNDVLIAVVGLELNGEVALLRSLAVTSAHRSHGMGRALVVEAERQALARGVKELFLLTNDAKDFFTALDYAVANRADAPDAIKEMKQFAGLCPDSAVLMHKRLS